MERLTERLPDGGYAPRGGRQEEILWRLGRIEDLYDALCAEREKTAGEMERLRAQGKTRTATYRQKMANKLMAQGLIDRIELYSK